MKTLLLKIINLFFLTSALLVTAACDNTGNHLVGEVSSSWNSAAPFWNFSNPADYTYDTNYVLISGSTASLKTVNTSFNDATTFNTGTYVGTSYTGSKLALSATANNELSSSWTPKWSKIVGYWKMNNNWTDSSVSGKDLTPANGATFTTTRKVGTHAGLFSGNSSAQNASWLDVNTFTEMTVAGWMYRDSSAPNGGSLFYIPETASYGGVRLRLFQSGPGICVRFGTGSSSSERCLYPVPINDDTWFHFAATHKATGTNYIYINGVQIDSSAGGQMTGASSTLYVSYTDENYYHGGMLDELAVWNSQLSAAEIALIYDRQKQKYAGSYESPVMDMGASAPWTNLAIKTAIPFYKELTTTTESAGASGYASVNASGEDLSSGLLGLWHMNETSGNVLADSSPAGLNLSTSNSPTLGVKGVLGTGVQLTRSSSQSLNSATVNVGNTFTLSIWANINRTTSSMQTLFANNQSGGTSDGFQLTINTSGTADGKVAFSTANSSGTPANAVSAAGVVTTGFWHHYVAVVDRASGVAQVYVDGLQVNSGSTTVRTDFKNNAALYIGKTTNNDGYLDGQVDEAAVWNRKLSAAEITQLYRRGANRNRYQVRSCVDAACACKSFGTSGTATDCSGDGTANDLAGTDPRQASWVGPDGTSATYFSELQNNSSVSGSGAPTGTVGTSGLNLDWSGSFFTAAARPVNNRYFQFRIFMESADENNLCAGSPCMPEATSVIAGPSPRYYGGAPTIVNNSSLAFTSLQTLTRTDSGSCTKYQISTDNGVTWKYWTGSAWAAAASSTDANYPSDFAGKLNLLPAGNFKFKAFLNTNTGGDFTTACTLSSVGITYTP